LNIGVSRNRFCDFLADPDSRSFSRFGAIIMQFAVFTPTIYRLSVNDVALDLTARHCHSSCCVSSAST
jgi:hypothetical protein